MNTIQRVEPQVVIAVGTLVCDFLLRYSEDSPPRLKVDGHPALLAIPHPSRRSLSINNCQEIGEICRTLISRMDREPVSYTWDHRHNFSSRTTRTGNVIDRYVHWSSKGGWKPNHRPADLDWLEEDDTRKIRYRLFKDGSCRYNLELDARDLRRVIGKYLDGPHWRRTGYVNPVNTFAEHTPTEELKPTWRPLPCQ